jgi:two-component system response regulator HydG
MERAGAAASEAYGLGAVDTPATQPIRVLVIDDEPDIGRLTMRMLVADGAAVEVESDPARAQRRLDDADRHWDVIVMDVGLPGISGVELLHHHIALGHSATVIMLTGDRSAGTAAACLRAGAFSYLTKPVESAELTAMVQSAARFTALRRQLTRAEKEGFLADTDRMLVGRSAATGRVLAAVDRLSRSSVSVLINGESGTGKELVARALHRTGPRRDGPFVAINCGALPEGLIDSELFGHQKGAFTGATAARPGVFVEADGGTLFLDEIGEMPLPVQARLLRALQDGEIRALGASGVRAVDVRVVAATHVDLQAAVEAGKFRQDLYYRLNVVALALPPLRERLDDLPLLVAHFLKKHGGPNPPTLSPVALETMAAYPWPGNIRELENAVLRAIALAHDGTLGVDTLPPRVRERFAPNVGATTAPLPAAGEVVIEDGVTLTEAKRRAAHDFEKRYLTKVLEKSRGSVSEAARIAGIDRTNFRRLLQRHGIEPNTFK